ncbi:MAG TPA: glycosyltransferase family 1 protein [Bacteroidales bacterium]|nr:glycosyltransferase family 1 protein [Bacteroidales bacterium]
MIIAVNTRLLIPGKIEGIGRFALETLRIITQNHPEHRFVFIFDRPYSDEFIFSSNIVPEVAFPPARHPFLWYAFFESGVPRILKKYKPALFLSPDGWLTLHTKTRSLPVIHDLNFFHYPDFIPYTVRQYYNYFFPRFIRKADRIVTVSEYTKADIISKFNYDPARIDVVYNGASGFKPVDSDERKQTGLCYAAGCPFFLSVGLIHPRKNISGLIRAYGLFRQSNPGEVKLVIAGARKWWTADMQEAYDSCGFRDDIIFTGRLKDEELIKLIPAALGLIYVSWFEGFGIPVLEAMYSETPVICSSTTSLPEVGGDAVLYADPASPASIANAMNSLYKDKDLRDNLIKKSIIRRELFTWQRTADRLWKSIEKSCESL